MITTLPREERFLNPAPQRVDNQSLELLRDLDCRNSVAALEIQFLIHRLMAHPDYYRDLRRWPRIQIQRLRGMAFDGFHPLPDDLDHLEHSLKQKTGTIHREVRNLRGAIEALIEDEQNYWSQTRGKNGLREAQQDIEAVHRITERLSGRLAFFGSARLDEGTPEYDAARWLSRVLVEHLGNDDGTSEEVVAGGGPGIMAGGARGGLEGAWAHLQRLQQTAERGGPKKELYEKAVQAHRNRIQSLGIRIELPFETGWNPHLQMNLSIPKFPARKEALIFLASGEFGPNRELPNHHGRHPAFFNFPGGIGTRDEIWEVVCHQQCGKMPPTPIFVLGEDERSMLEHAMSIMEENGTISQNDPTLRIKGKNHILYCENEVVAARKYLEFYDIEPTDGMEEALRARTPTIRNENGHGGATGGHVKHRILTA